MAAVAAAEAGQRQQHQQDSAASIDPLLVRPQSGCSNAVARPVERPSPTPTCASDVFSREPNRGCYDASPNPINELPDSSNNQSSEPRLETPIDSIDTKLADLELDDVALDCLLGGPVDRDCHSRSSRSSNEAEEKKMTKTKEFDAGNWS